MNFGITENVKERMNMNENLNRWYIDRKSTEAKRNYVVQTMNRRFIGGSCEGVLPSIFFRNIEELSDDEIRLLDNLIFMFCKGEESECYR